MEDSSSSESGDDHGVPDEITSDSEDEGAQSGNSIHSECSSLVSPKRSANPHHRNEFPSKENKTGIFSRGEGEVLNLEDEVASLVQGIGDQYTVPTENGRSRNIFLPLPNLAECILELINLLKENDYILLLLKKSNAVEGRLIPLLISTKANTREISLVLKLLVLITLHVDLKEPSVEGLDWAKEVPIRDYEKEGKYGTNQMENEEDSTNQTNRPIKEKKSKVRSEEQIREARMSEEIHQKRVVLQECKISIGNDRRVVLQLSSLLVESIGEDGKQSRTVELVLLLIRNILKISEYTSGHNMKSVLRGDVHLKLIRLLCEEGFLDALLILQETVNPVSPTGHGKGKDNISGVNNIALLVFEIFFYCFTAFKPKDVVSCKILGTCSREQSLTGDLTEGAKSRNDDMPGCTEKSNSSSKGPSLLALHSEAKKLGLVSQGANRHSRFARFNHTEKTVKSGPLPRRQNSSLKVSTEINIAVWREVLVEIHSKAEEFLSSSNTVIIMDAMVIDVIDQLRENSIEKVEMNSRHIIFTTWCLSWYSENSIQGDVTDFLSGDLFTSMQWCVSSNSIRLALISADFHGRAGNTIKGRGQSLLTSFGLIHEQIKFIRILIKSKDRSIKDKGLLLLSNFIPQDGDSCVNVSDSSEGELSTCELPNVITNLLWVIKRGFKPTTVDEMVLSVSVEIIASVIKAYTTAKKLSMGVESTTNHSEYKQSQIPLHNNLPEELYRDLFNPHCMNQLLFVLWKEYVHGEEQVVKSVIFILTDMISRHELVVFVFFQLKSMCVIHEILTNPIVLMKTSQQRYRNLYRFASGVAKAFIFYTKKNPVLFGEILFPHPKEYFVGVPYLRDLSESQSVRGVSAFDELNGMLTGYTDSKNLEFLLLFQETGSSELAKREIFGAGGDTRPENCQQEDTPWTSNEDEMLLYYWNQFIGSESRLELVAANMIPQKSIDEIRERLEHLGVNSRDGEDDEHCSPGESMNSQPKAGTVIEENLETFIKAFLICTHSFDPMKEGLDILPIDVIRFLWLKLSEIDDDKRCLQSTEIISTETFSERLDLTRIEPLTENPNLCLVLSVMGIMRHSGGYWNIESNPKLLEENIQVLEKFLQTDNNTHQSMEGGNGPDPGDDTTARNIDNKEDNLKSVDGGVGRMFLDGNNHSITDAVTLDLEDNIVSSLVNFMATESSRILTIEERKLLGISELDR